jgi:hypothetical protein
LAYTLTLEAADADPCRPADLSGPMPRDRHFAVTMGLLQLGFRWSGSNDWSGAFGWWNRV